MASAHVRPAAYRRSADTSMAEELSAVNGDRAVDWSPSPGKAFWPLGCAEDPELSLQEQPRS